MYEHIEHPEDTTEGVTPLPVGFTDPAEQTASDAEVTPIVRVRVRLEDEPNSDGWRSWTAKVPGMSDRYFDTLPEAHQWASNAATYLNTNAA